MFGSFPSTRSHLGHHLARLHVGVAAIRGEEVNDLRVTRLLPVSRGETVVGEMSYPDVRRS